MKFLDQPHRDETPEQLSAQECLTDKNCTFIYVLIRGTFDYTVIILGFASNENNRQVSH